MMLTLIIDVDGEPSRTVSVDEFPCRIGRHKSASLVLSSWRVARWHAEIHRLGNGFKLIDLGSIGGTWINGERVVEYGPLSESDEIVISGYCIKALPSKPDHGQGLFVASRETKTREGFTVPVPSNSCSCDSNNAGIMATAGEAPATFASFQPSDLLPDHLCGQHGRAHDSGSDRFSSIPGPMDKLESSEGSSANSAHGFPVLPVATIEWRRLLHHRLLQTIDLRRKDVRQLTVDQLRDEAAEILREIIERDDCRPQGVDVTRVIEDVLDEAIGLGPLERLLADTEISEIMVNRADEIYVERNGRLVRSPLAFSGEGAVRAVIERIVAPLGRRIDESSPMVDARLPDGSRVNAIIPPLAVRGSVVTIRRFNRQVLAPDDLQRLGSASAAMLRFLGLCIEHRRNIVIAGGTGSGKTTLLNVLSNMIPAGERIVTIEDAAELRLRHPHLVSLEARPANLEGKGLVGIRDLVRNALRMRPDRIVVGECRGGEALDMLQAMNTGHEGSLTTVHANSPRDVIARLETMVLMAGMDLPVLAIREQVASAIHLVVQQARSPDGVRRIVEIAEVTGMEAGRVQMQSLFRWERGEHVACTAVPQFLEDLRESGVMVEWSGLTEYA